MGFNFNTRYYDSIMLRRGTNMLGKGKNTMVVIVYPNPKCYSFFLFVLAGRWINPKRKHQNNKNDQSLIQTLCSHLWQILHLNFWMIYSIFWRSWRKLNILLFIFLVHFKMKISKKILGFVLIPVGGHKITILEDFLNAVPYSSSIPLDT